jgi:hypothetical protein
MLGRIKRTTRTDVGLALGFVGAAYLVWALVAGIARDVVQDLIIAMAVSNASLPAATRWLRVIFVDAGFVIDIVGVAWMAASLLLVMMASRQKCSVSWAWMSAMVQSFAAALGAVLVAWAAQLPYRIEPSQQPPANFWQQVSGVSLAVALVAGLVIWTTFLVWMLVDRSRYDRRGPTMSDGLRNVYR